VRPAYLIALVLALTLAYWSTGRADPALAPLGLNRNDCYQAFGTTYCGDDAARFKHDDPALAPAAEDTAGDTAPPPAPDKTRQRVIDAWHRGG
jgi:hypothetical protein